MPVPHCSKVFGTVADVYHLHSYRRSSGKRWNAAVLWVSFLCLPYRSVINKVCCYLRIACATFMCRFSGRHQPAECALWTCAVGSFIAC